LIRVLNTTLKVTGDRTESEKECNVSILGLDAVQQAAKIAQSGNHSMARNQLLSVTKLLQRAATSNIQQEEYSNFISTSEDLDTTLLNLQTRKGSSDDATVKTLQRMKTIGINLFQAGSKKDVSKRKKHTKSAMKHAETPTTTV